MKYLDFLNLLLSYGPKIGPVLEELQAIVEEAMLRIDNIRTILGLPKGPMRSVAPSAEEAKLEGKIMEAALEGRSAGIFQTLFDFIRSHPELITFLLTFLKK